MPKRAAMARMGTWPAPSGWSVIGPGGLELFRLTFSGPLRDSAAGALSIGLLTADWLKGLAL
jgi:hypothetical protein